jgi:prephenate dehydrogenase
MKLKIVGDGSFGSFLKELLAPHFEYSDDANSVILAVPISAYDEVASKHKGKHLINVCSIQTTSTAICLNHSENVTSIHPLFGKRTPADKRNSFLTKIPVPPDDLWEMESDCSEFLTHFRKVSTINNTKTPEEHDQLMAKTHVAAVLAAQQMKVYVERAKNIPDEYIPNSFRLLREFVKTLDDMPAGTIESIMANPYF